MSLCKSFQTLLGYSDDVDERPHFCLPSPGGLCLIARTFHKPPNVVESSALGKTSGDNATVAAAAAAVFHDEKTGAGGFLTCTETLGVESSDERIVAREDRRQEEEIVRWPGSRRKSRSLWRKTAEKTGFPPPLPGLDEKGRPRSFLKKERKDGRFVLTEVRIERPEVFSAKREGGRLRLHLHILNPTQLPTIQQQVIQRDQEQVEETEEEEEEEEEEESEESEESEEEMIRREGGGQRKDEGDEKEERLGGAAAGQWRHLQYQSCHHLRLSTTISPLSRIHVA